MGPSPELSILRTKVYRKLLRSSKAVYHLARFDRDEPKTIVFILGCQRSGTTLMEQLFERDLNTKVYAEQSKLSSEDAPKRLRLNPLGLVNKVLDQDRAPLIILKPLVESQNSSKLLDYFEGSKALWLYRHYKDVALSNVRKWGNKNAINDLKAIVEQRPHNWRYENVSTEIREIVLQYFSEAMDPYDAVALYWFVRNNFVFQLELNRNPSVMICKYENLVTDPVRVMKNVYEFLAHDFPGSRIIKEVHTASVYKGKSIRLSPQIDLLCQELLERLNQTQNVPDLPCQSTGSTLSSACTSVILSLTWALKIAGTSG